MVKRYAGGGISAWKKYLGSWGDTPAGAKLMKNYDTAVATPSDSLKTRYLRRTRRVGTTFSAHVPWVAKLRKNADANWTTTRSTTGCVITLADAAIAHASRRQHCTAMSTCEAELIALTNCAIELLYILELLEFSGHTQAEPIEVFTDNKAAYDLCHRFT